MMVAVTPGPTTFHVVHHSLTEGRRSGWRVALGAATGNLLYALAAAGGLSLMFQAHPEMVSCLKLLALPYLYAYALLCFRRAVEDGPLISPTKSLAAVTGQFRSGLLFNLINPLMAGVFLIVLPSSLAAPAPLGFLLLGLFHVFAVLLCHGIWVAWTGPLSKFFQRTRPRRRLFGVTGSTTLAFALWLSLQAAS